MKTRTKKEWEKSAVEFIQFVVKYGGLDSPTAQKLVIEYEEIEAALQKKREQKRKSAAKVKTISEVHTEYANSERAKKRAKAKKLMTEVVKLLEDE